MTSKQSWTLISASLMLICCTISSRAQEQKTSAASITYPYSVWIPSIQVFQSKDVVHTPYGDEYIIHIGDKDYRAIGSEHIEAIKETNDKLAAAEKTIALQADLIASLQRQTALDAKLDALGAAVRRLQDDQVMRLLAVIGKLDNLQANSDEIKGGMVRKSKLDAMPVRFGFTALTGVADIRSIFRPTPQTFPAGSIVQVPRK